uniref:Salivary secreted peptide n=1 Tax=Echinococcus granulosus TaxID=6210 RepID=A0A068WZ66_ECHGR|nr:hypothetical protein EgrG_002001200 [Echinococcus granulosus]
MYLLSLLLLVCLMGLLATSGQMVKSAAFNVQVYGKTKSKKPDVMQILVKVGHNQGPSNGEANSCCKSFQLSNGLQAGPTEVHFVIKKCDAGIYFILGKKSQRSLPRRI